MTHIYPVLGNDPVYTFPLKRVTTIGRPLIGSVLVNTPGEQQRTSVAGKWMCFLRGPCRMFIGDTEGRLQSVVDREAEWRDTSAGKEEEFG
jgi:hypothetical protein